MIDLNNTFKKKVLGVTLAIMAIAFVVSTGSKVLAQSTVDVEADTSIAVGDAVANASDVSAESGHGLDRVIKGTEKWGEEHNIDPLKFVQNIGKSTGIYQILNQKRVEPNPTGFKPELKEAGEIDWGTAPGWQSLIMIAVGFLIVYLAVGKGFEPLLLMQVLVTSSSRCLSSWVLVP